MNVGYIGSPSGNAIVPVANLQKQSKQVETTSTSDIAVTASNYSQTAVTRAVMYCYADSNGKWRLVFNVRTAGTSSGNKTAASITFGGAYPVVFKNTANFTQPIAAYDNNTDSVMVAQAIANTGRVDIMHASNAACNYAISGDVELESQPSWYAVNAEGVANVSLYCPSASASSAGLVDTSTQTFAGVKTFSSGAIIAGQTSAPAAGYVGYSTTINSTDSNTIDSNYGSYRDFTTNWVTGTLPAGTYIVAVTGGGYLAYTGGTGASVAYCAMRVIATTATTVIADNAELFLRRGDFTNGGDFTYALFGVITLSASDTFKVQGLGAYTGDFSLAKPTLRAGGRLVAIRIA